MLALLHLCDSLFPIGGFGYSDGLEAATASGAIGTVEGLAEWMNVCLDETLGRSDGPTLLGAWEAFADGDWVTLTLLDQEATALRPSSAARRSSRAMGLRLVTTWRTLHPDARLDDVLALARDGAIGPTLPVAFACAAGVAGVPRVAAAEGFCYTRLAATMSAAMRLMPLGQTDAHALLARTIERVPAVVREMLDRPRAESFAPAMDIAAMSQQYLHSRLFRS
jgi:urease accessory protein